MHDNILSTATSDIYDVELNELGGSPDLRGDNRRVNGQQRAVPLGVELTGFRLLTSIVILIGVPMAVLSYNGQTLTSATLDLFGGTIFTFILFWLGVIEATRPGLCPLFFQVDLAPPILRFLGRPEVHLWFLSVLPLVSDTTQLRAMLDAGPDDEHTSGIPRQGTKNGLTLAVLAFSTTVCIFCLQCMTVVWPSGFEGTILHLPFTLCAAMWLAHNVYLMVKLIKPGTDYPSSFIMIIMHNVLWISYITVLWMSPIILLPHFKQRHDAMCFFARKILLRDMNSVMPLLVLIVEATLIKAWGGLPNIPEGLYAISLSCYVAFFFSNQLFDTVLTYVPGGLRPCVEHNPHQR